MDNLPKSILGAHGTLYEPQSGLNVKVTKPDGQMFYIPLTDFYIVVCAIEKLEHQRLLEAEGERIRTLRPSEYIRAFVKL